MRLLFASTAGAGHVGPLVPFVAAAVRRGDEVLVVVPPAGAARVTVLAGLGVPVRLGADPPADVLAALWERFATLPRRDGSVLMNREKFGRLDTAAMLPTLEDACRTWRPDLVLRDPAEYASAIAAVRCGVPHAQVGISQAVVEAGSLDLAAPALEPYDSRVVEAITASPYLTRFPASLDPSPFPATRRYRDDAPAAGSLPDRWGGDDAPLIYVTFGTVAGRLAVSASAYRAALEAVSGLRVRVLLTTGDPAAVPDLGPVPANVHVEGWVPQGDVLAHAAAVVCHGGSGTVFGALAAGVPLVVVPLFADQLANGRLVAAAGAGLVVDAPDARRIRAAIGAVLADPSYRRAANRVADEMRGAPAVGEVLASVVADLLPGTAH